MAQKVKKGATSKSARTCRTGSTVALQLHAGPQDQPQNPVKIEGASGSVQRGQISQLLDQNFQIIAQIQENMKWLRVHENTDLLVRLRDNTSNILQTMGRSEEGFSQMPPLPVQMNLDLANSVLPRVPARPQQVQQSPQLVTVHMPQQMPVQGWPRHPMPQAMCVPTGGMVLQMRQQ